MKESDLDISKSDLEAGEGTGAIETYDADSPIGQVINFAKDKEGPWGTWDTLTILPTENSRIDHLQLMHLDHAWKRWREIYNASFIRHKIEMTESESFIQKFEDKDYKTRPALKGKARDQLILILKPSAASEMTKKKHWWNRK